MGTDLYGNKFFEIPVNSSSSRSRPSRWFEPPVKDDFQNEISSEWESWLRGRFLELKQKKSQQLNDFPKSMKNPTK